jgi:hypothetical protein
MTWPNSLASSASRSIGIGSFFTVDCFGGGVGLEDEAAAKGSASFCNSSTACRNDTPSARITQSIAVPPV